MVSDTCLSQPRNHGGDMVLESVYSIRIVSGIALCLLDIVLLGAEKLMLLGKLSLCISFSSLRRYFEISLPCSNFEESLASVILCPDLVPRM